ncbi:hypothetical protein C8J57DRAFT_1565397 [Mycena rebaudengoi]|nr:hypothetical protein C8J57DRAFT_1565397 [Mycena rebaudengoi]
MSRVAINVGSGWTRALVDGEKWIDAQYTLHAPTPKRYTCMSTSVFVSRTAAVEHEDGTDDARVPHCEGECRACHGGDGRRALDNAESSLFGRGRDIACTRCKLAQVYLWSSKPHDSVDDSWRSEKGSETMQTVHPSVQESHYGTVKQAKAEAACDRREAVDTKLAAEAGYVGEIDNTYTHWSNGEKLKSAVNDED